MNIMLIVNISNLSNQSFQNFVFGSSNILAYQLHLSEISHDLLSNSPFLVYYSLTTRPLPYVSFVSMQKAKHSQEKKMFNNDT